MRVYNGTIPSTVWVIKLGENPAVAYMNEFTAMHNVRDFVDRRIDEAVNKSDDIVRIKELVALRPYLKRCEKMKVLKDVLTTGYFKALPLDKIEMEEVALDC